MVLSIACMTDCDWCTDRSFLYFFDAIDAHISWPTLPHKFPQQVFHQTETTDRKSENYPENWKSNFYPPLALYLPSILISLTEEHSFMLLFNFCDKLHYFLLPANLLFYAFHTISHLLFVTKYIFFYFYNQYVLSKY